MSIERAIACVALVAASCAAEPAGVVVVVDAQPWGRANATEVEVIVLDGRGVQKADTRFLPADLPVRIWIQPAAEGRSDPFVLEAILRDAADDPVLSAVATGESGPTLRTATLCVEDGCRGVLCDTAAACSAEPASCRGCSAGACMEAALRYGGSASCPTTEAHESACFDAADGDHDGPRDCEDEDCDGRLCADGGRRCIGGECTCPSMETSEIDCDNGVDDDCDGRTDCDDPACVDGTACDALGRRCEGGSCRCPGTIEICDDGVDDDCDGAVDCDDVDCDHLEAPETECGDGLDNDCDGLLDCDDPDCNRRPCGDARVCCGTSCTNIGFNEHCGRCNARCGVPSCDPFDRGGHVGYACACSRDADCPRGQYCNHGDCNCSPSAGCEAQQQCSRETGDVNFCWYDYGA